MQQFTLQEQTLLFFNSLRYMDKLYDEYAKTVGLTYQGLNVLNVLYETPDNCTQKLISERIHLPKQSVNVIIRSLWEQGYIEMKELDSDRRNKTIRLSASGREYADRIVGRLLAIEGDVFARLTYGQRQEMIELADRIRQELEDWVKKEQTP